jgi:hypothetical protein
MKDSLGTPRNPKTGKSLRTGKYSEHNRKQKEKRTVSIVGAVFKDGDRHMTNKKREQIATQLLEAKRTTTYTDSHTSQGNVRPTSRSISSRLGVRPGHRYNPDFDEVTNRFKKRVTVQVKSNSAHIPKLTYEKLHRTELLRKTNVLPGQSKCWNIGSKVILPVPDGFDPFPKDRPTTVRAKSAATEFRQSLNRAYSSQKEKRSKFIVNEVRDIGRQADALKGNKYSENDVKKGIRKRLSEFKRALGIRLAELKHPQASHIMRCIDDSMIFHFTQKYKGNNIGIDAIVDFLVGSVGSIGSVSRFDGSIITPDAKIRRNAYTPKTRATENVSLGEEAGVTYEPQTQLDQEDEQILALGLSKFSGWSVRTGTANRRSRRIESAPGHTKDFGAPVSPDIATMASGFRRPVTSGQPLSRVIADNVGAPSLSIDPVRYSKEDRPIWTRDGLPQDLGNPYATHTVRATKSKPPSDPDNASVEVIRRQMEIEGTLPSMQPIRALTDEEMLAIGSGASSFEAIASAIISRQPERMEALNDSLASASLGGFMRMGSISNNRGPMAVKTHDPELQQYPRMPYELGDEIGKILSSGLASGAGLMLMRPSTSHTRGILSGVK